MKLDEPKGVSEVRSFLGMINLLMKSVHSLADLPSPLRCFIHKGSLWSWGEQHRRKLFQTLKEAASKAPVLASYRISIRYASTRISVKKMK